MLAKKDFIVGTLSGLVTYRIIKLSATIPERLRGIITESLRDYRPTPRWWLLTAIAITLAVALIAAVSRAVYNLLAYLERAERRNSANIADILATLASTVVALALTTVDFNNVNCIATIAAIGAIAGWAAYLIDKLYILAARALCKFASRRETEAFHVVAFAVFDQEEPTQEESPQEGWQPQKRLARHRKKKVVKRRQHDGKSKRPSWNVRKRVLERRRRQRKGT